MTRAFLPDNVRDHLWRIYTGRSKRLALARFIAWIVWTITVLIYIHVQQDVIDAQPATRIVMLAFSATIGVGTGLAGTGYLDQHLLHQTMRTAVRDHLYRHGGTGYE